MADSGKKRRIPVCSAIFDGKEREYLNECIDTGWVSSSGPFVRRFEELFAQKTNTKFAVTTSSGTSSLHLALLAQGVRQGDEVIIPSLTMIATGNAVLYTGATPVIVDVDPTTGNIDPAAIEEKITDRTRAVIVVHLYGLPCAMRRINEVCSLYGVPVIEDAAEAIGTTYAGRPAGSLGSTGCFSFFANKVITSGEGGMLVTNFADVADKARRFKDQCFVPERRFYHPQVGFNYRMSNLQAAVGLAQLERVETLTVARARVANIYGDLFRWEEEVELPLDNFEGGRNSHWMYALRLRDGRGGRRERLADFLRSEGVDTRSFFYPLHRQPAFSRFQSRCPVSDDLSQRGLLLPTGPTITPDDQVYVAEKAREFLTKDR